MKVLVLGFSVTAERPGYIDPLRDAVTDGNIEIARVGLGGLQPYHARYLFPGIIADHAPDLIVLDHATPGFRKVYSDQKDYERSLCSTLRECHARGIRIGMVDFPRTDVDYSNDWVSRYHEKICGLLSIPYRRVIQEDWMLRDEVHPTPRGNTYYAKVVAEMIGRAREMNVPERIFDDIPRYDAVRVANVMPGHVTTVIGRGEYRAAVVTIPEGETIHIPFERPMRICGMTTLMGPRTGVLEIQANGLARHQMSYDQFCYYSRMGAFLFPEGAANPPETSLRVTQLPDLPEVELAKGEKDLGPRVGGIGHIFTEESPEPPSRPERS